MEDFKHLNASWKRNVAWHNQPKRLLECVDNNVLMLCWTDKLMKRGALLDLPHMHMQKTVG